MKSALQLTAFLVTIVLALAVFLTWQDVRRQQAELQARLAATQQQLQAADAREQTRNTDLRQQLAKLTQQQKNTHTPQQAVADLPNFLPLPKPIQIDQNESRDAVPLRPMSAASIDQQPTPAAKVSTSQPNVTLPREDVKPLYDFAVACKACQLQLAAAQADLKDEKAKTLALGRERDDALRVARGGSVLQRVAHAAKWFVIGAAVGAATAKLSH